MGLKRLISGGQTGVDRGALDAALEANFPCGGWCPEGRMAEDGAIADRYPLSELPGGGYAQRTRRNVVDADGTLIIYFSELEGGTEQTLRRCLEAGMPYKLIDGEEIGVQRAAEAVTRFIHDHQIEILNVAGPRASKVERSYGYAHDTVRLVLQEQAAIRA